MKFSHSFRVVPGDIDEQGHVNNVVYVRWIQEVAVAHWQAAVDESTRNRLTWMLTRHEIDYRSQAFAGDRVTATTWVGKASRVTCERFTEIKIDDRLLVSARSSWCLIDRNSMRPARIAEDLRVIFGMQPS